MRSILFVALAIGSTTVAAAPVPLIPELTPTPPPLPANPVVRDPIVPTAEVPAAPAKPGEPSETEPFIAKYGSLERQSLHRALVARGYAIDPAPENKLIGAVHVVNEEVFAENNRVLRFFNHFHVTTREGAIRKELVIGAGEVWDQDRVDETVRRLRDPLWSSVVAIVPVQSREPGKVDMLVVTRDVWSLRLNTKYSIQADREGNKLTALSLSLSENNFLGRRSVLAAAMTMDQSEVAMGPLFINKNLLGQHVTLSARVDALFNRDRFVRGGHFDREGSDSTISIARQLWSLASEWGAGASFSHNYSIQRSYRGTALRTFDNPDTAEMEAFPFVYRYKSIGASAYVTRQWGKALKQQITLGYSAADVNASPYQFDGDAAQRAAFIANVLPRTETSSGPYVEYSGYQPVYKTLRNLQTYDLGEDARFGLDYSLTLGAGSTALGASANHWRAGASGGYTFRWCRDGFVRAAAAIAIRHQDGISPTTNWIDNTASGRLRFATPSTAWGRVIVDASLATRWTDTQNRFYSVGSDTGLRGFLIDEFIGDRAFNVQAEARSRPFPIWVFRTGGVVFYEAGGAANSLAEMGLHHDAGFGVRALVPQTSRELFRFDLAFPLDGQFAGTPRFIAGFESAF